MAKFEKIDFLGKLDPGKLLDLIKRSMRLHESDNEIRARMAKAGLVSNIFVQRRVDELIAQARHETRIPDPSDQAAVQAAQPIKFMDMSSWDDEPPPAREWAVLDRIPGRQVTLFSGEGGLGKTILTLQLLCSTVLNRDWIGSMPEPGPCIYLGAEDEEDELHRRLAAIAAYYDEPFEELIANGLYASSYAGKDMTLARFNRSGTIEPTLLYDRLHEQACDIRPAIVAVDTLSDIFAGSEIDRVQVSAFMGLMRKLAIDANCALIINSHPSQAGTNSGTGTSGSTAWHGKARGRMYMRADNEDPELRILEFKKNQYGPLGDNIPLRYKNGVFVPEPRGGSSDPQVVQQRAEQVFLDLLDRFARDGRNVSDKVCSTYAPTVFADEQEAKARNITKNMLKSAMSRLFASGKIRVVTEGPVSRPRSRLMVV